MKPVVILFASYYLPGYKAGGPIKTLTSVVERLGHEFTFHVVTRDHDLGTAESYPGITPNAWIQVGSAQVMYCDARGRSLLRLIRLLRTLPDGVLYLNSFFDPSLSICCLLLQAMKVVPKRRIVIAPRGELSTAALEIKNIRKRAYLALHRFLGLGREATWQASTRAEADDIVQAIGVDLESVVVAPDLLPAWQNPPPPATLSKRVEPREIRVCFLARICSIKNLDFALECLRHVYTPVEFHVYGPLEDLQYWERCLLVASKLPPQVRMEYMGPVQNHAVPKVLSDYDLFFVPSKSENFGHVYLEALSAGTPVLVSDCTPWRGLASKGVGWDIPLHEKSAFIGAIAEVASSNLEERARMRGRCIQFARSLIEDPAPLEATRQLLSFGGVHTSTPNPHSVQPFPTDHSPS